MRACLRMVLLQQSPDTFEGVLDVIVPDAKATGQVIANFAQVVKEGDLRIHPMVAGLVDDEMRGQMMTAKGETPEQEQS